jgi:hypothetical protein
MSMPVPAAPDSPQAAAFRRQVLSPAKLRLFMLRKLPMAWLAGLRLTALTPAAATVTIRYKYLTQNPFRSIYFACLAMAAELASGIQAMLHTQGAGHSGYAGRGQVRYQRSQGFGHGGAEAAAAGFEVAGLSLRDAQPGSEVLLAQPEVLADIGHNRIGGDSRKSHV